MFKKLQFTHCKAFIISIFRGQLQAVRISSSAQEKSTIARFRDRVKRTYTLFAVLGLMGLGAINAQSADLVINPSMSVVGPGDSFTVTVEVLTNSNAVQAVDLAMTFDPTLLQVSGSEVTEVGPIPEGFFNSFDNTLGTITYQAFLLGGGAPTTDFSVVQIEFTAQASGIATIGFDQLGSGTQIAAPNGDLLLGSATPTDILIDNTAPTLILLGANPQEISQGDPYIELGATANDDVDGNITANIMIDDSAVNTNIAGPYQVTYDVMDSAGNPAVQAVRMVNVVALQSVPVISLDATGIVSETGTLILPLSITDDDGDNLTVTITSVSNEPDELQNNNGGINVVPYPNSAAGFLNESGVTSNPGTYSSTLQFTPTFGDGASDGDGSGTYTVTVQVDDEDGNMITSDLVLTVNDTPQTIPNTGGIRVEAESYDDQGNSGGGDGIGVETGSTGFVIGYTTQNDFVEYTLDIQEAGTYQMDFLASRDPSGSKDMEITTTLGTTVLTVDNTTGWDSFQVFTVDVVFEAGVQTLRFDWVDGGGYYMNMDYFDMTWMDAPPTVDAPLVVEVLEGDMAVVNIQVNDDIDPSADIIIYDKSILGTNNPFTPGGVVDPSDYNFINNGGGSYTLEWQTQEGDGRSYQARILANDGTNPTVEVPFTISIAQDISCGTVLAKTFSKPLPWYGPSPQSPFTVAIENTPAQNIGYIGAGEFVEYLVNVPVAGTYDAIFYVAKGGSNPSATATVTISVDNGGGLTALGNFVATVTGWQSYAAYPIQVNFTNSGMQTLRLDFGNGVNVRDFTFSNNTAPTVDITSPSGLFGAETGTSVTLSGTASDVEEPGISGADIEWYSDLDGLLGNGASISTSSLSIGAHLITATVTDNDPTCALEGSATVIVYIGVIPAECYQAVRVNAGGPLYASSTGDFEEDQSVAGGNGAGAGTPSSYLNPSPPVTDLTFGTTSPLVSNATGYPDYLFLTERYSEEPTLDWAFPTGDGTFNVDILFNENWNGEITNPRVFDVEIEGILELDDYRPSGTSGTDVNVAKVESFQVNVTDGILDISFIKGTQNPSVKGFSICRVNDTPDIAIFTPGDGESIQRGQPVSITGEAIDEEDGDISSGLSWSSGDPQFVTDPPNDTGAAVTGTFVNPGPQTLRAEATDSQGEMDFDEITVNVQLPAVVIDQPLENDNLTDPNFTLEWTGIDVLYNFDEHYHIYVNPTDINAADPGGTRISTAEALNDPEEWLLGPGDGIVNGNNSILIRIANSNHDEIGTPPVQDLVNFTVCDVSISEVTSADPTDCGSNDGTITISAIGSNLEFSIDGGGTWQANGDFNGLAGDISYSIIVRDSTVPTCEDTASVTLNAPVAPSIDTIAVNDTSTCGASDGEITINATGFDMEYSNDGGSSYQDSPTFSGLPAGDYQLAVREKLTLACIDTDLVTVSEPFNPMITSVSGMDPQDCLTPDGSITISATGSDLLYSIDGGVSFQGNGTFTGLAGGSYNIVVKENADDNCQDTAAIVLVAPAAPVITFVSASGPSDCDLMDGSIILTATGVSLEYSIDYGSTFQTMPTFTGLDAGTFGIVVREAGTTNCEDSLEVTTTGPTLPELFEVIATETTDCGVDDGLASINASGSDLEYSIDGNNWQLSPNYTGLASGSYIAYVRVENTNNCSVTLPFDILAPVAPAIVSVVPEDPSDCGVEDGSIVITATGINLEYSIDGGGTFGASGSFADLVAGTYNIVVREVGTLNCVATDTAILTSPAAPVITNVVATDVSDCDVTDGTITITATGNDLEYSINNGPFQDHNVFTGLPADMYNIEVREKDATSCSAVSATGINAPDLPSFNAPNVTDPSTCDSNDGSITIFASGGTLEYRLDGGTFGPSNAFNSLGAGTYTIDVRIIGTVACINSQMVTLVDPDPPVPVITGDPSYLQGTPGTTLDAGEFVSYLWSNGANTQMITATAGTYSVTVTDANGCEGTSADFDVSETPDSEDPVAVCQPILFIGLDANGMASITAQQIDNGSFDNAGIASLSLDRSDFSCDDLGAVDVTLTVVDINGRSAQCTTTVVVEDYLPPTITCPADIVITVPFGSPGTTVNWPEPTADDNCPTELNVVQQNGPVNGSFFSTNSTTFIEYVAVDLLNQTYCGFNVTILEGPDTLTITRFWLVNADTNMDITEINEGDVFYTGDLPTSNLNIRAEATLDTESVEMELSGTQNNSMTENVEPYALYGDSGGNYASHNFANGPYSLSATPFAGNNGNGASGDTMMVNFSFSDQNPLCDGFELSVLDADNPTTCGGTDGEIDVILSFEAFPITYSWSHDPGLDGSYASGLGAGIYTVSVTDGNGCFDQIMVELEDPELPNVTLTPFADLLTTDAPIVLSGGMPMGGSYSGPGVSGGEFDPAIGAGTYTIEYEYTDGNGCTNSTSQDIQVNPPFVDAPLIVVNANTDENWFALVDGMTIPKSLIGNTPLGVIFNPDLNPNGVVFNLSGPINKQQSEGKFPPYSLFGDIGVNIQGQPFPVGQYTLIANPNNGPTQIVNFEVSAIDPACINFDASISATLDPSACGADDGSASISVTGFTGPLTINWSHGGAADQTNADELEAGNYSVTVTDANGCTETLNFSLEDPDLPVVNLAPFGDVLITNPAFALMGGSPGGGTYSGPGVSGGTFSPIDAGAGTHTIVYSYTDSGTGCSNEASQDITVIDPGAQDSVVSFTLVDALDGPFENTDIGSLEDGDVLPGAVGINIRANTNPNMVGSVKISLTGPLNKNQTENFFPYALFGDSSGDYNAANLPSGNYTLTATPYSQSNGNGNAGIPLTIDFSVNDSGFFNKEAVNPVKVSPNPADRTAKLDFLEPTWITDIYLFDVSGKLVKTIKADSGGDVDSYLMRVQDLPEATYFVKIKRNRGLDLQQRVVIKR